MSGHRKESSGWKQRFPLEEEDQKKVYGQPVHKEVFPSRGDRWITLKVSAAGMRNINKNGLASVLKEAKEKGYIVD